MSSEKDEGSQSERAPGVSHVRDWNDTFQGVMRTDALACPGCGTSPSEWPGLRAHVSRYDGTRYQLHRCSRCDLAFWSPLRLIPEYYEQEGLEAYENFHAGTRPFPRWALPFFQYMPPRSGLLLDVGCGDGAFLQRAAGHGFTTQGIDLDRRSIDVARRRYGLTRVEVGTLAQHAAYCNDNGIRYDVITFFEVLEHQDDPAAFLRSVAQLLASNGRIAGSVPNRDRFLARLEQAIDDGDLPPHHFLWFSASALRNLLVQRGFDDIVIVPAGHLKFAETGRRFLQIVKRKSAHWPAILRYPLKILGWLGAWPAALILWAGLRRRPGNLYFQARRPERHS